MKGRCGAEGPGASFRPVPIVSVVGRTNSGKTSLIEKLIPALGARGYRIATIKHHHHGDFEADHPGKDSWRHARAGAAVTALAGARQLAIFQPLEAEMALEEIARLFVETPDLILTEGYQQALFPKLEVLRVEQRMEPLCRKEDQLIALVTDGHWELGVPRFALDAIGEIARFLVDRFLTERMTRPDRRAAVSDGRIAPIALEARPTTPRPPANPPPAGRSEICPIGDGDGHQGSRLPRSPGP